MMSVESNSEKSVSCQKKDGRGGHVRPSFFWYDTDKDLKVCFLVMCVMFGSCSFWPHTQLVLLRTWLAIDVHDKKKMDREHAKS